MEQDGASHPVCLDHGVELVIFVLKCLVLHLEELVLHLIFHQVDLLAVGQAVVDDHRGDHCRSIKNDVA